MRRLRAFLVSALAIALCAAVAGPAASGAARPQVTYKKCGAFRYKGKHVLFTHKLPCAKAERKARYVLRHRRHPPHWKCSLAELSSGFAACHRGRRSWEFVPG